MSRLPTAKRLDYYVEITNNNRSALTDELKLGEDKSDPINVHPELNSSSSPRPCVGVRNFFKNFGREHANAPNNNHMREGWSREWDLQAITTPTCV